MNQHDRDCILLALPLELGAVKNYQKLSEMAINEDMKKYFELFEANEQGHVEGLKELISKYFSSEQMQMLDEALKQATQNALDFNADLKEILIKILEIEEKQVRSYNSCAESAETGEAKTMFYHFSENEKIHAEIIKKLILSIEIPVGAKDSKCRVCETPLGNHLSICHNCAREEMEKDLEEK